MTSALPYRGTFGAARPAGLPVLPPRPMPSHLGRNPLKAWRYVGCFSPETMVCVALVRVGPARQAFYAIYDRLSGQLHERTGAAALIELSPGRAQINDPRRGMQLDLTFAETPGGVETVTAAEGGYAWTRKQAGLPGAGRLMIQGHPREVAGGVIIDDSSGYHPRHTQWRWCAGVGTAEDGRGLAWNLVEGIHDSPVNSERTLWVDGAPSELPPTPVATDLTRAGTLSFAAEAERASRENRILVRSRYRQPFGTFSGTLGGITLATGYGVMEEHDAYW